MKTQNILMAAIFGSVLGFAQVPADIVPKLVEMGRNVCVEDVAKLYKPLQLPAPKGIQVKRDISYGPDAREVMDVAWGEKGGNSRTVLIYVSGGAGNKTEPVPDGAPFYQNMLNWAVANGMTAVTIQRRAGGFGPDADWEQPGKDIGAVVEWVHQNIAQYKGNPKRVFIWAHSAGNPPTATYLGRPELYGPDGIGLVGAILMSPAPFDIAPVQANLGGGARGGAGAGGSCPTPQAPFGGGAARGGGRRGAGGPGGGARAGGRGRGGQDPQVQLERSLLPGLEKAKISFFLAAADLDPTSMPEFIKTLGDELTKNGQHVTIAQFKDHSHVSEVFSPNTKDTSVTGPILKWMKSVK